MKNWLSYTAQCNHGPEAADQLVITSIRPALFLSQPPPRYADDISVGQTDAAGPAAGGVAYGDGE